MSNNSPVSEFNEIRGLNLSRRWNSINPASVRVDARLIFIYPSSGIYRLILERINMIKFPQQLFLRSIFRRDLESI